MCGTDTVFDQSFCVLDLGPRGFIGPVELKLFQKMSYGASISVVACTDHEMSVNVKDSTDAILLHMAARPYKNDFGVNSYLNTTWGFEEKVKDIPIKKGVRFNMIMNYEKDGYRIFIDGKEIIFYKHRSENVGTLLQVSSCHIFKITYLTTVSQYYHLHPAVVTIFEAPIVS